jgi:release factor glutamine methyltransferase
MGTTTAAGTVRDALTAAADALTATGVDSPRLDAELMLAEASGRDRARLAAEPEAPIDPGAARVFGTMVRRRLRREPLAYILGRKGFRGLELQVDRRVLIPRPETELLVDVALEFKPDSVLDVGTGSGAVALAVADELPGAEVTATDASEEALGVARANAAALGLDGRVSFLAGTIPAGASFELILANLPYVAVDEWAELAPEIRDWEPREALLAGPDGLDAIRDLLAALGGAGADAGAIALEVGAGQADRVSALMRESGFAATETRADLAGTQRVVIGKA